MNNLRQVAQTIAVLDHAVKSNGRGSPLLTHMMNKRTRKESAMEQPEQEPTCPECKAAVLYECVACSRNNHPPQRKPLTDAEIEATFLTCNGRWDGDRWVIEDADFHPFVRAITALRAALEQPEQRKPLTINEVEQILAQHSYEMHGDRARYIVRMTEEAHGIKETP